LFSVFRLFSTFGFVNVGRKNFPMLEIS
jgi:hypothetical protein